MTVEKDLKSISLGLEELVVVINLLGYPEVAKGLLVSQLGEMNTDEERGRLLAANHSLMAKDILYLQGDRIRMEPTFAKLLGFITSNNYAVRIGLRFPDALEQTMTYYVRGDQLVEQHISQGVVHTFREMADKDAALDALLAIFKLDDAQPFEVAPFIILNEQIEQARAMTADGVEATAAYLRDHKVSEEAAVLLAEDLESQALRAAVMNVSIDSTQGLTADQGYLLVEGTSGRAWLMDIKQINEQMKLLVQPASEVALRKVSELLFAPNS